MRQKGKQKASTTQETLTRGNRSTRQEEYRGWGLYDDFGVTGAREQRDKQTTADMTGAT